MEQDKYWVLSIQVFAFEDKCDACDLRDKIEETFMSMPEFDGYGFATTVEEDKSDVE